MLKSSRPTPLNMISLSAGLGYWTTAQADTAVAVSFVSCLSFVREDNLPGAQTSFIAFGNPLIRGTVMAEAKQQLNPQLKKMNYFLEHNIPPRGNRYKDGIRVNR